MSLRTGLQNRGRTTEGRRRYNGRGVSGRVNILRTRSRGKLAASRLGGSEELKTLRDRGVVWIQLCSASISVDGIGNLVVAALVQTSKVEPDLRDVRIDANCTRVCIKCITELIDLEVKNTN
jgi:hypothetical protein